ESRGARVSAAVELRGDRVDAHDRILRAQAGLHGAVFTLLDEGADLDAIDAARVVHEALGVLRVRTGRGKNSRRQNADAHAATALEFQRGEEVLQQFQLSLRLPLVELVT